MHAAVRQAVGSPDLYKLENKTKTGQESAEQEQAQAQKEGAWFTWGA